MRLLFLLLFIPLISYSQANINCPPGQVKKKDINGNWKCIPEEPLPVKLLYFKGEQTNNTVTLYWSTATETNSSHFLIEGANDIQSFTTIQRIETSTNSNKQRYYNTKVQPYKYYRLVQVDLDNTTTYHQIIFVDTKEIKHKPIYDVIGRQLTK